MHALCEGGLVSCDFKIEDTDRPGQLKIFEDEEMESLLYVVQCKTRPEMSDSLEASKVKIELFKSNEMLASKITLSVTPVSVSNAAYNSVCL